MRECVWGVSVRGREKVGDVRGVYVSGRGVQEVDRMCGVDVWGLVTNV
jgi:hypothetical protein